MANLMLDAVVVVVGLTPQLVLGRRNPACGRP
jgi:hypothetical protein